jgi:hypothetical protein
LQYAQAYHSLTFSIDGYSMGQWTYNTGLNKATYPISAGSHRFEWVYDRGAVTENTGAVAVSIDDIAFPELTTTATPGGGAYSSSQDVVLTVNDTATIYYTTDGSTPTTSSTVYSGPINISATTTLKFFAISNYGQENIQTANYQIGLITTATPKGGIYRSAQSVTLTPNDTATVHYTTDGSTPTTASTIYTGPVNISSTTTLRFFAVGNIGQEGVNSINYLFPVSSTSVAFDSPVQISLPYPAWSIATADYNQDGKADLAVANYNQNTVTAYRGNGDGTFTSDQEIGVGSQPTSVTFGIVNGYDTLLDIVAANNGSGTVSLLLGNGINSFSNAPSYAPGAGTTSAAVGHFRNAGPPDLAVTNYNTGYLNIYFGQGQGVFNPGPSYYVGTGAMSVVKGYFNNDTKEDLALVNYDTGVLTILTGNGDGSFNIMNTYNNYPYARSVSAGDINGDGKSDLVVVSDAPAGSAMVTIFLGNNDGTFYQAYQFTQPQSTCSAAIADFNGDGMADLAMVNRNTNTLTMLFQSISFGVPVRINPNSPIFYPTVQAALTDAQDGEILETLAGDLYENLSLDRDVHVTLRGGVSGSFGSVSGYTTLHGTLTISSGSLVAENLIII